MGSLMSGWDSSIPDAKKVMFYKTASMTKEEINSYWRNKRIIEEEHLLAAFKSAARIKIQNFTDEDYRRYAKLLEEEEEKQKMKSNNTGKEEGRMGIKDWWTKSSYAYLNQPPLKSMDEKPKLKYLAQFDISNLVKTNNSERSCFSYNALRVF